MKNSTAAADLSFIKQIIDESRQISRDDGLIHITWGAAISIGGLLTWIIGKMQADHMLGYLWAFVYIIAFGLTVLCVRNKKRPGRTLASGIYAHIWIAVGVSALIVCFAGIIALRLPLNSSLSFIAMLLAGAYFVSSKTADYRWMRFVAVGWWLSALLILFSPEEYAYVICTIATFFLEFVSGIYLRLIEKRKGAVQ